MDDGLTIRIDTNGMIRIQVHRDPTLGYSAQPGLDLLQRLLPAIKVLDDAAAEACEPQACEGGSK
jgi:hypothetical protein